MNFNFKDYLQAPLEILKLRKKWKMLERIRSREEKQYLLNKYILERLKFICSYSKQHIPYYRDEFLHYEFDPEKIDGFDYFSKLPIISKDTVRTNFEKMQSDEKGALNAVMFQTSGSTGTPLYFFKDKYANAASFAMFWRVWENGGEWRIGNRIAALTGYEDGKYFYQWKTRLLKLSSFYLNEENALLFYNLIKKFRPKILRGYPSALYLFAKLLEARNLSLKFPIVITESETLLDFQKDFIEQFYGAKVMDHYSHWEGVGSIYTCECGKKHLLQDFGYHEIITDSGKAAEPGEEGRLVCTGLYNRVMPLIRYDTRDLARLDENQSCDCGSVFPIVSQIFGRVEDVVVTPDGRFVGRLDAAFKYSKNIELSSIYQPDMKNLIVSIAPTKGYNYDTDEKPLIDELRKRLGDKINIKVNLVKNTDIPRTKGGKVRFVISDIPAEKKLGHI